MCISIQRYDDLGPVSKCRFNGQLCTDGRSALTHDHQAPAAIPARLFDGRWIKALPVVCHGQASRMRIGSKAHYDLVRVRMLRDVDQRVLSHAKQRMFGSWRQSTTRPVLDHGDCHPRPFGELVGVPAQHCRETEVVQHRRSQLGHDIANIFRRLFDHLDQIVDAASNERCLSRQQVALYDVQVDA